MKEEKKGAMSKKQKGKQNTMAVKDSEESPGHFFALNYRANYAAMSVLHIASEKSSRKPKQQQKSQRFKDRNEKSKEEKQKRSKSSREGSTKNEKLRRNGADQREQERNTRKTKENLLPCS